MLLSSEMWDLMHLVDTNVSERFTFSIIKFWHFRVHDCGFGCRQNHKQKWVPGIFLRVKHGRRIRLTTSRLSVSRLAGKCWESQRLTTLWAFTACCRNSFPFEATQRYTFMLRIPKYLPSTCNKLYTEVAARFLEPVRPLCVLSSESNLLEC
jgi:hypothetical protein